MTLKLNLDTALQLLAKAPCGIVIYDSESRVLWNNRAMSEILGAYAGDKSEKCLIPEEDLRHLSHSVDGVVFLPATTSHDARWLKAEPVALLGLVAGARAVFYVDVSEQIQLETEQQKLIEELDRQTTRDAVTGLPNRRSLMLGLEPLISRSRRYDNALSVIRLRIRDLDSVDATGGAKSSERALLAVTQLIKDQTRWADLVGRYNQNEFLLVLPETPLDAAKALAQKLAAGMKALKVSGNNEEPISVKVDFNTATWRKGDDSASLVERADPAGTADSYNEFAAAANPATTV